MIKALDCYVEAFQKIEKSAISGKAGVSLLRKIPAVLIGSISPRLKLLDTLGGGKHIEVGLITRPSDSRFIGLFMADKKSSVDHGSVVLEDEMTTEILSNLVSAGLLDVDKQTKQLYRHKRV